MKNVITRPIIPQCRYGSDFCFAYRRGWCMCLQEMPRTQQCPFFKTWGEVDVKTKELINEAEKSMGW